jgi:hypothetical protein
MTKARDLADLATNDVLETTSTGVDVTGTVTADGATFDGYVTVNNSMDLNGSLYPDAIFMMDSKPVVFGSDTDVEVFWGGSYLNLQTKGNDIRIMDGLDTKLIWDASAERLGIGTSSPDASLHVNKDGGTSADVARSAKFESGATNSAPDVLIIDADNSSIRPSLKIKSGAGDIFNVMSDGNVGIGTSSPSENLHIVDSAFATLQIESTGASSDPELLLTNDNGGASEWSLRLDKSKSDIFQIRYNNASKMILDTSGNVGIGVTNPDTPLVVANGMKTVVSDSGIHNAVRMDNSYAAGITAGAAITWQQSGNIKSSIEANTYGSDYMSFKVGGNTERMKIDGDGRVTMPYQPAFAAHVTSAQGISTSWEKANFNGTRLNEGGHYNTSTSRFTAPVDGVYVFNASVLFSSGSAIDSRYAIQIFKNGDRWTGSQAHATPAHDDVSVQQDAIIPLSANDYVEVYVQSNNQSQSTNASTDWTNFSGYLLG